MTFADVNFGIFDWLLVLVTGAAVFGACKRGLGKETLHTLLFVLAVSVGLYFLNGMSPVASKQDAGNLIINFGYYVVIVSCVLRLVLTFGAPLILDGHAPGMRSSFWAGVLALVKTCFTLLALNLWLAVHSPDAHPHRLQVLPGIVRDSAAVQYSDGVTDRLYRWLASKGVLHYAKYTQREVSDDERRLEVLSGVVDREMLKLKP